MDLLKKSECGGFLIKDCVNIYYVDYSQIFIFKIFWFYPLTMHPFFSVNGFFINILLSIFLSFHSKKQCLLL